MPVIIRSNSATELCITRGQEAIVHAWQSTVGSKGQRMLDTLFVELQNPPKKIQFDGLPPNVVPLTRTSAPIKCSLPNDEFIFLTRSQVEVLPNFAMTDYSSQGKTRPDNPVDLNNCRTHQSYYTALSRSASAAGTCILQGFDSRMVTGGASGALRQEFRELELLDEIVRLRYEGKLPITIVGDTRGTLVYLFRSWRGESYLPPYIHKAIRWSKKDPFLLKDSEINSDLSWHIVDRTTQKVPSAHATYLKATSIAHNVASKVVSTICKAKRKLDVVEDLVSTVLPSKKPKPNHTASHSIPDSVVSAMPEGTIWSNNSCAYDAVLVILYSIWSDNPESFNEKLGSLNNEFLNNLLLRFTDYRSQKCSLEDARDDLRRQLEVASPNLFSWGSYVGADSVLYRLLQSQFLILHSIRKCPHRHRIRQCPVQGHNCLFSVITNFHGSAQHWLSHMHTRLSAQVPDM